jgi:hypothetical protein
MEISEPKVVIGVFEDRVMADRAVGQLREAGFSDEQIGYARRGDDVGEKEVSTDTDTSGITSDTDTKGGTQEGLVMGAVSGGALGGIVGAAAALLIPGLGPVFAGGILAAAFTAGAIGAATGGVVGALREWGVSEEEAGYYQGEFEAGRSIVTVRPDSSGRQIEAEAILGRNGAYDATRRRPPQPSTGPTAEEQA